MTEQEILEAICDIEIKDENDWNESRKIELNPEKLAKFLLTHLKV